MFHINLLISLTFLSVVLANDYPGFVQVNSNSTEKYYLSNYNLEFIQAYAACRRYGWTLTTEKNLEETAALNALIMGIPSGADVDYIWIAGIHQADQEFTPIWMWLDSGEEISYSNWESGQPSMDADRCVAKGSVANGMEWYPYSCYNTYLFICKDTIA